jgi:hypothetical protein
MIWLLWVDSETVRLGMTSAEARTASFRLELYARGRLERLARVRIAPGERWDVHLDLSSIPLRRRSFLAAELYRQGEFRRNRPYRRVTLAPPGGGLLTLEQAGASP